MSKDRKHFFEVKEGNGENTAFLSDNHSDLVIFLNNSTIQSAENLKDILNREVKEIKLG